MNDKPLYKQILDKLDPENKLKGEKLNSRHSILERLCKAHQELHKSSTVKNPVLPYDQNDLFAINQCLHLSTTLVLLTSTDTTIEEAKKLAQEKFPGRDPTTFLTISMLFYLLRSLREQLKDFDASKSDESEQKSKDSKADKSINPCINDELTRENSITIIQDIEERFSRVNWMIGDQEAKQLGIR